MAYWLNLFTMETWEEFKAAGGSTTGFREARWGRAQKIKPGDRMLCYLVGAYRWIGILDVIGEPYFEEDPSKQIWVKDFFPSRVPVQSCTN